MIWMNDNVVIEGLRLQPTKNAAPSHFPDKTYAFLSTTQERSGESIEPPISVSIVPMLGVLMALQ
jgi:hypothetical protein